MDEIMSTRNLLWRRIDLMWKPVETEFPKLLIQFYNENEMKVRKHLM